ncbi:hypothetical protein B484DRAFT_438267 [Ochromonadaceae sp. CCMP2298]|nr:hypothetical protein B484DRAFT_438267 [Ochromonadaceae sp. CCMP2298]
MELEDLGLDTIISIYCARGENFSQKIFKEALKELGLSAASTHKMYKNMDKWRIAAGEFMEADKNLDTEVSFSSGSIPPTSAQQAQEELQGDLLAHYHGADVVGHLLPSQAARQASIQTALAVQAAASLAAMTDQPLPPATAAAKGKGKKPPVPRPVRVNPSLHNLSMPRPAPEAYAVPQAKACYLDPPVWVSAIPPDWLRHVPRQHEPDRQSQLWGDMAVRLAAIPTPYLQPEPVEKYRPGDDRNDSYRHAEWREMHRALRVAEGKKVQSGLDLGGRYPCSCRRERACSGCTTEWEGKFACRTGAGERPVSARRPHRGGDG